MVEEKRDQFWDVNLYGEGRSKLLSNEYKAYRKFYVNGKWELRPDTRPDFFSTMTEGHLVTFYIKPDCEEILYGLYLFGHGPMFYPHKIVEL